ncbi:MAG TPA: FAD-dependent oxidoreductase [Patescibacteria group bacterium]|nr:FAD-dependent oxidoreductase [Patescibacteria group bacterium]
MYDLIIIGGGPGGSAAAVYAGRKKLKTLMITEAIGGQSTVSASVENWIGTKSVSGFELAKMLEEHVKEQKEDVEIIMPERVTKIEKIDSSFRVTTDKNHAFETKTVLVTSGGRRRRLNVPGEDKFEGKGVVYCSTCDAPLFRNKEVAVIGGGNAGLEAVEDLLPYASKITLVVRSDSVKGDPLTLEEIQKSDKVNIIYNATILEVLGDTVVAGIRYRDTKEEQDKTLNIGGVFVEIGSIPNSEFLKGVVQLNERNEVVIDHQKGTTSQEGIFAAGDVTDELYKQNNISAGDAVKATLSAYNYLLKCKKESGKK